MLREFRDAWRRLLARPGYSALAVLVLGVGLGTTLFLLSLVDGLILKPMPFPDAERLVAIGYEQEDNVGIGELDRREAEAISGAMHGIDALGTYAERPLDFAVDGHAAHLPGCRLSASMLGLLGAQPVLGRGFTADDERPDAPLAVLVSDSLWRDQLGGAANVVGRSVRIDGEPATVVGVMAPGFAFPSLSQAWIPARLPVGASADVRLVARLGADVALEGARADLRTAASALGDSLDGQRAGRDLVLKPLALSFVNERTRAYVWLMFAAGALVLLLACANVANLQLGQTMQRQRELAVRCALGASRARLLREQFVESFMLALAATALALLIAQFGADWIERIFVANGKPPPYFVQLGVDARLAAFAGLAALMTAGLAGAMPAWRASRTDVQDALRDGGKGSRGGGFTRISRGLVVVEVALTVVLLVGAGTFINGLERVFAAPGGGDDPAKILIAHANLHGDRYPDAAARARYADAVVARLRQAPGIENATVANTVPNAELGSHEFVAGLGQARPHDGYARAQVGVADPHFLDTYGLTIASGRFFAATDADDAAVVVDAQLAQALWPDRPPLGQRLLLHPEEEQPQVFTVIGVVESMQLDGAMKTSLPSMLLPLRYAPPASLTFAVRTRGDVAAQTAGLPALVAGVDPDVALYDVQTQAAAIDTSRISSLVITEVFGGVGLIALLLAAAGLYGVLAFSVSQRTREIGIRRAIGASAGAIAGNVGRQLLVQLGLGLATGIALALPWSALLADARLQTEGREAGVFVVVTVLVIVVAVVAALVPLRRALRVDPVIALRQD